MRFFFVYYLPLLLPLIIGLIVFNLTYSRRWALAAVLALSAVIFFFYNSIQSIWLTIIAIVALWVLIATYVLRRRK